MTIHVYFHDSQEPGTRDVLDRILADLKELKKGQAKIMATEAQVLELVRKIDDATTEQGNVLAEESTTLQTISDDIDRLLQTPGIPDSVLSALQAHADNVAKVSTSIHSQSEFSKAIASKGTANPVPVPVPEPTTV